jgi:hypothetical protein
VKALHSSGNRSLAAGETTDTHELVKLGYRTFGQLKREVLFIFCNAHNASLLPSLPLPAFCFKCNGSADQVDFIKTRPMT